MNWTPDRHSFLRGLVEHMSRTGSCAMCTLRDFAWQRRRMHTRRLAGCCSVAGALRGCVGAWVRAGSLRGIRGDLFHTATLATHFGMQSASWCWCCTRNRRRFGMYEHEICGSHRRAHALARRCISQVSNERRSLAHERACCSALQDATAADACTRRDFAQRCTDQLGSDTL